MISGNSTATLPQLSRIAAWLHQLTLLGAQSSRVSLQDARRASPVKVCKFITVVLRWPKITEVISHAETMSTAEHVLHESDPAQDQADSLEELPPHLIAANGRHRRQQQVVIPCVASGSDFPSRGQSSTRDG